MSLTGENTSFMMPVTPSYGGFGGGNGGFGFGGDGAWWIILFLIFGWGRNGWGNDGGMNGGVGSEVQRGFDHSAVITKLDGINYGLADGFYAVNNAVNTGFNGTQMAIMQGNNAIQAQLAECCCTTQRAIDGVNYNLATQACDTRNVIQNSTRDIIDNQNTNARAVLDALNQNYIRTLESENQSLKLSASQANQNAVLMAAMDANKAEILRRSGYDCPTPAYVVNPPTPISFNPCNGYAGCNNGYGYAAG